MKRQWLKYVGWGLLAVAVLMLFYAGIFYFALQDGEEIRQAEIRAETIQQIERQIELAEADLNAGDFNRAIMRADWVLDNNSELAQTYHDSAQNVKNISIERRDFVPTATPTSVPPTITPTPIPPTITPTPEPIAALEGIEAMVEAEDWEEAIPALIAYQTNNPNFRRQRTDALLYEAYIAYGIDLLYTEQVELGVTYLHRAEELGQLPQEAQDQLVYADLYVQGIAYYGVDWGITISYFGDLCLVAPFFQDACETLYEARAAYGDQFADVGEWCPAEIYYTDAWRQENNSFINNKRLEASQNCREATPTPTVSPTPWATPTP